LIACFFSTRELNQKRNTKSISQKLHLIAMISAQQFPKFQTEKKTKLIDLFLAEFCVSLFIFILWGIFLYFGVMKVNVYCVELKTKTNMTYREEQKFIKKFLILWHKMNVIYLSTHPDCLTRGKS